MDANPAPIKHFTQDLGLLLEVVGDGLAGVATITPEMHVPGTTSLRTSILAVWTDTIAGLLAVQAVGPRVPMTVDLDVHVFEAPLDAAEVRASGRILKVGRTMTSASVDYTAPDGTLLAVSSASFVVAPDATLLLPEPSGDLARHHRMAGRLAMPLAKRVGCERVGDGVASLPRTDDGLNAAGTINGGLLALVAEEAVLAGAAPGATLSSLSVRYLRAARVGPAEATATGHAGLHRVEVRDAGSDDRVAVVATARLFPPQ